VARRAPEGTVAVVATDLTLLDRVGARLAADGITARPLTQDGPAGVVALVPATLAKGLEFDAVVLLEPAAVAQDAYGLRLLYVALTRAVSSLTVLHRRDLPAELGL